MVWTMKQVAERLGMKYRTLHYHVLVGHLPAPAQVLGGMRLYSDEQLESIRAYFERRNNAVETN